MKKQTHSTAPSNTTNAVNPSTPTTSTQQEKDQKTTSVKDFNEEQQFAQLMIHQVY